jgi:hypothetical protein
MNYVPLMVFGLIGLLFCVAGIVESKDILATRHWQSTSGFIKHIETQVAKSMDSDSTQDKLHFEFCTTS